MCGSSGDGKAHGVVGRDSAAQKAEKQQQGVARNLWVQPDAAVQREYARFEVVTIAQPTKTYLALAVRGLRVSSLGCSRSEEDSASSGSGLAGR